MMELSFHPDFPENPGKKLKKQGKMKKRDFPEIRF
jgi:hypothetical protein